MSDVVAYHVMTESKDPANLPMCKEIAEYLVGAYPGHPWFVRIDGGMLMIKNMNISSTWAMLRPFAAIAHDAKRRKHDVVMAAGEFLECAAMARGRATGETAKNLEGRKDANNFTPIIQAPSSEAIN
jgi:hypothetical protein